MRTIIGLTLALAFPLAAQAAPASWKIDSAHSSASFSVRHLMVTNVRGSFSGVEGMITYDPADLTKSSAEATIDVTTINTQVADRDAHLKSPDFFEVEKHPTMTFKSKRFEKAGEGKLKVTGDLTLHGVTKEVVLDVDGPTPEIKDMQGRTKVGASAQTKINRKDFGLTWNKALETGGVVVGDEVSVTLDLELNKEPAAAAPKPGTASK